ncbi:hypothetical protein F5Y13DRAFT_180377 [Hypoxylon sp. FL1857]|nr:hypothetical protein F5Y13DRAFT_180377 [Hypoxylon sp. FL1857]
MTSSSPFLWLCKIHRWLQGRLRMGGENLDHVVSGPPDGASEATIKLIHDLLEERENNLQIAADKLHEAQLQNKDLGQFLAGMNQEREQNDRLKEDNLRLKEDSRSMSERLARENESRIFSLLPYYQELTIYDAIQGYEGLIRAVENFVDHWIGSLLGNDKLQMESIQYAQSNQMAVSKFNKYLRKWEGLYGATIKIRDIDHEILNGFILRYLLENVFSTVLCNAAADVVSTLDTLEYAMNKSTDPKPDTFCVKSWRAQAHHAMVAHPDIRKLRIEVQHDLSADLAYMLSFIGHGKNREAFENSISTNIIDPALRLHEKFLTSPNDFSLGMDPTFRPGQRFNGELAQLKGLRCVDIAKNHRNFVIDKLSPIPSEEDLRRNLQIIFSVRPALIVTKAGHGKSLKEPTIICKEQMLVAWIPQEGKEDSILQQGYGLRSWLSKILSTLDCDGRAD